MLFIRSPYEIRSFADFDQTKKNDFNMNISTYLFEFTVIIWLLRVELLLNYV